MEGDLSAIIFNPVASTIAKWRTFGLLRQKQNLHQSTCGHETLYVDRSSEDEQTLIRPHLQERNKNTIMAGG
jgi:hypothetical protein